MKYYTVYKTTNLLNGKIYIGSHQTNNPNDSYYGSGKLITEAIDKYGKHNFVKEVLAIFDNPADMYEHESILVNTEFVNDRTTYNLCEGGNGGFGPGQIGGESFKAKMLADESFREKALVNAKKGGDLFAEKLTKDIEFRETVVPKLKENFKLAREARNEKFKNDADAANEWKSKISKTLTGRKLPSETRKRMSAASKGKRSGENNNAYGKIFINNGEENKMIKKDDPIPNGWVKGRLYLKK